MNPAGLAGRRVLLTRPAGQTARLAELVRAAGGEPVLFPALEIVAIEDSAPLVAVIDGLDTFSLAIFISANAVDHGVAAVRARRAWPAALRVAAVGGATAQALRRRGFADVIVPAQGFDSEALLALPELNAVAGKRVAIFRGAGGRELLADTLRARGAGVEYAECYRRIRPHADTAPLAALWQAQALDAVTATSAETLTNLRAMLGEALWKRLQATPLFVPHERIAAAARSLGVRTVVASAGGDEGLIAGIEAFFARV